MILWCDGAHDPGENMGRDAALLRVAEAAARAGSGSRAVLRLFAFRPAGITLGHAQDPASTLDLGRCRSDGVPWAIRPTGGRAIFHADEWTYSLTAALSDPQWGGGLAEAYDRVSRLIRASLARLGVPAELARGQARIGDAAPASAACFAATARHEIVLAGRKLVGSAQRRTAWALLQQGSVMLGPGHLRLADYLAGERGPAVRRLLEQSTALAGPWLGIHPPLERWADALAAELGSGARRLAAAEGRFLLTLPETATYTPAASSGRDPTQREHT